MPAAAKMVLVEAPTVVHIRRTDEPGLLPDGSEGWDVEARVMAPGESIPLEDIPPYLAERIEAGEVPGLKALTKRQISERAELVREISAGFSTPASFASVPDQEDDQTFPAEEY